MNTLLDGINTVIKDNKIETGGALNKHIVTVEYENDGDSYYAIHIPFWSNNSCVVNSCFTLVDKLRNARLGVGKRIYLRDNKFIIEIYESFCDPD